VRNNITLDTGEGGQGGKGYRVKSQKITDKNYKNTTPPIKKISFSRSMVSLYPIYNPTPPYI